MNLSSKYFVYEIFFKVNSVLLKGTEPEVFWPQNSCSTQFHYDPHLPCMLISVTQPWPEGSLRGRVSMSHSVLCLSAETDTDDV